MFLRLTPVLLGSTILACAGHDPGTGPAGPPLSVNEALATNATVRFVDLEGGCWAIETPAGTYEPIGLPAAFRIHGLAVHVVLRGAPEMVSVCQMAPLVRLDSIRAR
jgi:hypothetical protein